MVFKRYIKKKGKMYGPYYYESYREDGKVKSRFLGMKNPSKNRVTLHFLIVIILALLVFGILFSGIRNDFFGEIKSFAGIAGKTIDGALDSVKFLKNENGGGNNNPPGQDGTPPGQEERNETPPGQENRNQADPAGERGSEDGRRNEGGKSSAQIEKEKKEKDEKTRKEKEAKEKEEKGEKTKGKSNIKIIKKINLKKYTLNESQQDLNIITERDAIVVGREVRWTKNVSLSKAGAVKIKLPKQSENITVSEGAQFSKTKKVLANKVNPAGEFFLFGVFKRIFAGITGNAIEGVEEVVEVSLNGSSKGYFIEYYTPAPEAEEKETSYGKEIVISGLEELNYTNILAFTKINESIGLKEGLGIKVYWVEENSYVEFNSYDIDKNGIIDYLEWNVLHLSEQTFKIILISKAEHLDGNRTFVEDVYDFVKARDDNWTEPIPVGDYLRVSFERNLTSDRDITIYARSAENGSVKVYEKDEDEMIADFGIIQGDEKYKIYLTNLNGSQDVFDLKIFGGSVEFDYVVDPLSGTGTLADPYLITNCTDLQQMNDSLGGNYSLTGNIDCSDTINWNGGLGFEPVGIVAAPFKGTLNGQGFEITDLYINRTTNYVGLFGRIFQDLANYNGYNLLNFSLVNADITGASYVGGVAGSHYDSDSAAHIRVSGKVTGTGSYTGGVFGSGGYNDWENISSSATVSGASYVGGIVGGTGDGHELPNMYRVFSTGNVTGTGDYVGGIYGWGYNSLLYDAYSTGNITGVNYVGGITGSHAQGITLLRVYSTGYISGTNYVGGITGRLGGNTGGASSGNIQNSFTTASVSGTYNVSAVGGGTFSSVVPATLTNVYWYNHSGNPDNCFRDAASVPDNTGCTMIDNTNGTINYFKGDVYPANKPMNSWGFFDIWKEVSGGFPILAWQGIGGDYVTPNVTIIEPNATTYSFRTIDVEIKINDTGYCLYSLNGGLTNITLTANASETGFTNTTSALANNNYTLKAYCNNTDGIWNRTVSTDFVVSYFLGEGTLENPYNVTNCGDLQAMNLSLGGNYSLTGNIDCSDTINWNGGLGFEPVGETTNTYFYGSLDGNDYNITDLVINRPSQNFAGLFGAVESDSVVLKNINLINVNVTGGQFVGGLVGATGSSGGSPFISFVSITGNITSTNTQVGGLVGLASGGIHIESVGVNVSVKSSSSYAGGMVGQASSGYGYINNSYSAGKVVGGSTDAGGIIGRFSDNFFINNSYSSASVIGGAQSGAFAGTISSSSYIQNSFSAGNASRSGGVAGGFVGADYSGGTVGLINVRWVNHTGDNATQCYYDGDSGAGDVGCTAITDINYFKGDVYPNKNPTSNWSFFDVWQETINSYPVLTWQGIGGDYVTPNVTIIEPNATTYSFRTIDVEIKINDTGYCLYSLNGGLTNITLTANASETGFTNTTSSLTDADYTLSAYCNNSDGIWNRTTSVAFTINLPATVATIISPSANTYVNSPTIPIEIKINNSGICNYTLDLGVTNTTLTANASATGFTSSRTFSNGAYSFYAYCIDNYGQKNYTTYVNFSVSYTAPVVEETVGSPPDSEIIPESPTCSPSWECSDWSSCLDGQATRSCSDANSCGTDSGKPSETQSCELSCTPNVQCSDWSECNYAGSIKDIFAGTITASGSQNRLCSDLNSCISSYSESQSCSSTSQISQTAQNNTLVGEEGGEVGEEIIPVVYEVETITDESGAQYVETINSATGQTVSKISVSALREGKLEVEFVQGNESEKLPNTCFNAVQDGDETGTDCGGLCGECKGKKNWLSYLPLLTLVMFVVLLIIDITEIVEKKHKFPRKFFGFFEFA